MVFKPIIPKEHGAWAVLFVPMAIAAATAERVSADFVLLALASLCVFLAYLPAQILLREATGAKQPAERIHAARSWAFAYTLSAAVFGGTLLLRGYWLLAPIAVLGAACFVVNFFLTSSRPKSIASDLAAVVGLTLTGPAGTYVLTGNLSASFLPIWVLTILFFGSSVFYVHMKIAVSGLRKERLAWRDRLSIGQLNILYHAVALVIIIVLIVNRFTPSLAILAFLPISIHAILGTIRLSSRVRFRRLGFLLMGHSLVFGFLLTWLYS